MICELKKNTDFVNTIFENLVGYAIVAADFDGNIIAFNEGARQIYGYAPEEVIGKQNIDILFPPELIEEGKLHTIINDLIHKGRFSSEGEKVRKNGERFPAQILFTLTKDNMGKMVGFVEIVSDLTDRKRAEQKIQEALERETEARHKLDEEMKKRVEFTRTLVHELKTPLTSFVASSGLLAEELPEGLLLRMAKNMNRSANDLVNMVDELIDMTKGELGMLKLSLTSVDPLKLLKELAEDMSPVALSRQQSLILDVPLVLPPVRADEKRLRQVILNLMNNACKFMDTGGKITLKAKKEGYRLIVEVKDTGPGISKAEQNKLFTPYYRGEGDKKHISGLGLGLALCKTLVELHEGQIWVKSKIGEGSTFGFSIPLATTSRRREAAKSQKMMAESKSGT
jgi:PAS domain S-box-containing protein